MGMVGVTRTVPGRWRDGSTYQALVPAPIAGLVDVPVLAGAHARIRELDAAVGTASDLTRSLLAVEGLSSRVIVGLVQGRPVAPSTSAMAAERFVRACRDGARATEFGPPALLRAHGRIVHGGGTLRQGLVWIGGVPTPAQARFVPPPAGEVTALMADLSAFLRRDDLCPVAQAVIGYAQLVLIHPFRDGNGRLGRWLLQVVPRRRGVVRWLAPPLGLYMVTHAPAYMGAHERFRAGDLDAWCAFAAAAITDSAAAALRVVHSTPSVPACETNT